MLDIPTAADLLKRGGLVAFPTETVYGLGASVFQEAAIRKIYQVKGRPQDNPLIVHIAGLDQLPQVVHEPPEQFWKLAEAFFPGPLTILLSKLDYVSSLVSAGLSRIGVRMPSHPLALELIRTVGEPLVAPSANLSGKPSSTTAEHVWSDFGATIDGIVDGGPCAYGLESTVIALEPTPCILRPGAVTREQLEEVLGCKVEYHTQITEIPLSPGTKYRHYAPQAKVRVFDTEAAFQTHLRAHPETQRLVIHEFQPQELYALLRRADDEGHEEIVIYCNEYVQSNAALMNRILRAADLA